ncbi:hypothetical protein P4L29_30010 [Bacillus cereus]|nr:hypothetical protein [Bacillus cereus]
MGHTIGAVKHEAVDPLVVSDEELFKFDPLLYTDPARAMNAANSYAKSIGYAAGISMCNRNSDNNWIVYGIKEGYAETDSLNAYDVNHYINFSYNGSIDENYQLLKAHELITDSIGSCSELTSEMLQNLRNTYRDTNVVHRQWDDERPGGCDDQVVEGCARVGERYIWINFERINRTNNPNKELAQVLIHEMMHVAGYRHPKDSNDPDYKTSAPVLASKCIQ